MGRYVEIRVKHLDCENEAAVIARGLSGFPGVSDLKAYAKAGKVSALVEGRDGARALEARLAELGFPAEREELGRPSVWRNPKVLASLVSGVLVAVGWAMDHGGVPAPAVTATYVASLLVGGWYFGREALEDLVLARLSRTPTAGAAPGRSRDECSRSVRSLGEARHARQAMR